MATSGSVCKAGIGVATLSSSELVVTQQPPATITAGSSFGLTVQAEDSSGNLISSFNGPTTVGIATTITTGSASLSAGP